MNSRVNMIAPLVVEGVEISVVDQTVRIAGVISMRSPSDTVTPYLKRIHSMAIESGAKALNVDLTQLKFMNSASIRALVDWVEWIKNEPESRRYVLTFLTKPELTWQAMTLSAIQTLGGEHVVIKSGA